MRPKTYTDDQLKQAVQESISMRQLVLKLNLKYGARACERVRDHIAKLNLDIAHFKGMGWSKNKKFGYKRDIEDYFSGKALNTSHYLRRRLIEENIFPNQCSRCGLREWMNEPIPLELHHIDGNHNNNRLENLTILCPNCHSQTPTHSGKNKKKLRN